MASVKAIILKNIPYTETQKILHVFSFEKGYMSFISPILSSRHKNTLTAQCLQIVEMEYIPNERGGLHKLKSLLPEKNTMAIYFNIYKMNIALLWGEILNLVLQHEEKNEALFEYIEHAIEYLNTTQEDIANFNLFFLFRLCQPLGFRIDTSTFLPGHVFNMNDGCFYPQKTKHAHFSGPHAARIIQQLCTCQLSELKHIPLNRESRSILLDILLLFISFHLNINLNTPGINIIRSVFA